MTTESQQAPRGATAPGSVTVLLGAAVAAVVLGVLLALVGAVTGGPAAAFGALAGTLLVVSVLALGSATVAVVARLVPAASLLVALLTYVLQVLVIGLAFAGLSRSGLLDDALHRGWLAAGVVAGTLVWVVAQVFLATRVRIPAYDLPVGAGPGPRAASGGTEAGAR